MKKVYTTIVIALLSINAFAQAPNWEWAKGAGGRNEDWSIYTTTDGAGNVYTTGRFYSHTIVFGSFTLTNSGDSTHCDMFFVKYNASGNVLWAKSAGGSDYDYGTAIASDSQGHIYLLGEFASDSISFGTVTLAHNGGANTTDIFIVKYDTNGNVMYAKKEGGTSTDYGTSIAIDNSDNIYITGSFYGNTINFDSSTLTNVHGGWLDMYVVKFDTNGTLLWAHSNGNLTDDAGNSITTDTSGVYVAGEFSWNNIVFGSDTLTNTSGASSTSKDLFVVKYSFSGAVIWAKGFGGIYDDLGFSIANDFMGNIYVCGTTQSNDLRFGTDTLHTFGYYDIFIVKLNPTGSPIWAKNGGGTDYDAAQSLVTNNTGVFVTGLFSSNSIALGSDTIVNTGISGNSQLFVSKYDFNGTSLWNKTTLAGYSIGYSIAVKDSNLYITGQFIGSPNYTVFGSDSLFGGGNADTYLAKLKDSYPLAISELKNIQSSILIYPNPFTSQTTITFSEEQRNTTIKIIDLLGECIQQLTTNNKQLTLDMTGYAKGIYFVQVTDEKKNTINKKIIIQ